VTRFAWLQARTQTLVAIGMLAALAVVAAITGIQLSHLFSSLVAHCSANAGCGLAISQFLSHDTFMDHALDILARAVPALLGAFWGAPLLAREFETGTYRLAWTHSVTRSRWLFTRLALGAIATVTVAGLLTLTITWWYRSRDQLGGANPYAVFDRRDIAPIAYATFAFASGALIGAVIRRTVPAMAVTLGVFAFIRVAISIWVRPHLLTPVRTSMSLLRAGPTSPVQLGIGSTYGGSLQLFAQAQGPPRSWTLSSHLVTTSGHQVSSEQVSAFLHQYCRNVGLPPAPGPGSGLPQSGGAAAEAGRACLAQVAKTFHLLVTYQPANRYWAFQWLETGIFVALALAAAVGCYRWVTRHAD
jgi:ABC-type transport system involved in multi-copper enzyme maturation permease subunit